MYKKIKKNPSQNKALTQTHPQKPTYKRLNRGVSVRKSKRSMKSEKTEKSKKQTKTTKNLSVNTK